MKNYHHGNLKQELISCACVMCERDGYTKLSIRSLAKESNVSQTAPYRHFKTKEDLYAAVSKKGFNKLSKAIHVDVGDSVKKGQVLAKLDDREASAQLNQAKAAYELSKQILERFENLRQQGHISIQDLDKARSDYIIAKSQFEFFEVKLLQTNLIAPFDGIIQSRFLDTGTVINSGIPILEIIDSNYVEAHISVPVIYLEDMEIGKEYNFEFDGEMIKAVFSKLAPMSPGGSDSRLAIFKFNKFFNPGSIASLEIKITEKSKGTWIPLKSLSQSEQGLWSVYTIENNIVVKDLIEIIYFEDDYAYVRGTLKNNDLIVLGGASKIIEGKRIN